MLSRSRAVGVLDVGRVRAALSGPGIDTRVWVSLAIVDAVTLDPTHGVICDVTLVPSLQSETARVGSPYAGKDWGAHLPVYPDDEVLVVAPSGDFNQGLIIVSRLFSPSDPPPQDAIDNPDDVCLTIQPGQSVRLRTDDGGEVVVNSDGDVTLQSGSTVRAKGSTTVLDAGNVLLGGDSAAHPLIFGDSYKEGEDAFDQSANTAYTTLSTNCAGPPPPSAAQLASFLISFCTDMETAIAARQNARALSLSGTSKTS